MYALRALCRAAAAGGCDDWSVVSCRRRCGARLATLRQLQAQRDECVAGGQLAGGCRSDEREEVECCECEQLLDWRELAGETVGRAVETVPTTE